MNAFEAAADLLAREVSHVLGASEATQRTYLSAEVIEAAYERDDALLDTALFNLKDAGRALLVSMIATGGFDEPIGKLLREAVEATVLAQLLERADEIQLTFPEHPPRDERGEADEEWDRR